MEFDKQLSDKESRFYKFIRVGEKILIPDEPDDVGADYFDLANQNGLIKDVNERLKSQPDSIDSGAFCVIGPWKNIRIVHHGIGSIERQCAAARQTVDIIQARAEGYKVETVGFLDLTK